MNRRTSALVFSAAFGVLMVAAATRPPGTWGLAALALQVGALAAAFVARPAAGVAVLLTAAGMALADPVPLLAAVSGLSAAAYLVSRYADDAATLTVPTVLGMVGFAVAAAAGTAIPVQLNWVPLLAPAIMAAILVLVVAPLVGERKPGPAADREPPG